MSGPGEQTKLFEPSGEELRNHGIQQSVDHANEKEENWSDMAFEHFKKYAQYHLTFMTEDVREYANGLGFPIPPSKRAWGAVVLRAKKEKIIKHAGFGQVKNPKAHRANASIWKSLIAKFY